MNNYKKLIDTNNWNKINKIINEMPIYISDYFKDQKKNKTSKTLLGYAYDVQGYLTWLSQYKLKNTDIKEIPISIFSINTKSINQYINQMQNNTVCNNTDKTINRKISAMNSICISLKNKYPEYFQNYKKIKLFDIDKNNVNVMNKTQIKEFLNLFDNNQVSFSQRQQAYIKQSQLRDKTIIYLLITTGIRISECVALDIKSIDIKNKTITVPRETSIKLIIPDKTIEQLQEYLKYRKKINTNSNALFLSIQNKRICIQAIENMIKKFSNIYNSNINITPKTFRHTFSQLLYNETENLDLLNSYLGKKQIENLNLLMNDLNDKDQKYIRNSLNKIFIFL